MNDQTLKQQIQESLKSLNQPDFSSQALALFATLGYDTSRQALLPQKSWQFFKDAFLQPNSRFNESKALVNQWQSVDLLFQLSQAELSGQLGLFENKRVDNTLIETYLFLAIELKLADYSRTALAQITREVNRLFPMPVMVLFKYGQVATLAVINRRLHKRDEQKDVLEKVTVIKDISLANPHRAHIEILFDLSLARLRQVHPLSNFVELHNAWQKTLDTKELNKRFYRELSNWYFWAMQQASFPDDNQKDKEIRNATNLIRLLTRILFVWFIKEKKLVPERLFEPREVQKLLKQFNQDASSHSYYNAILQNLFFATLNQKIEERAFASDGSFAQNRKNYGIKNLYRYADQFTVDQAGVIALFRDIPFLNGGLFDCLDKDDPTGKVLYEDGFSRNPQKQAILPDALFFSPEIEVDLSRVYDDKKRSREKVKGLIPILTAYKFTVTENTPIEEDIALDPELLGRVFENLLASYNPETQTTARKQTGSFYTPREIVNYMVDESLKAYLGQKLESEAGMRPEDTAVSLEFLLGYNEQEHLFDAHQTHVLIKAIDSCKILDPACGSGAFPMGILHKLVHCLHKLDPQNSQWKERQIEKAQALDDPAIRDNLIEDIETAFANNELDYGRKLYLIENCIYGVDIQPIATQISKLRFFISLIVDQKADRGRENFGIRPLPNLETKFVAANTLIGVDRPQGQLGLFDGAEIRQWETDLKVVRHRLFSAPTPAAKRRLREEDKRLREGMAALLVARHWDTETAQQLAGWDPYDQNATAPFFDPEWMFGGGDGFDVVISNPPYLRIQNLQKEAPAVVSFYKKNYVAASKGNYDLYVVFVERGLELLNSQGHFAYILPHKFFNAQYGAPLRGLIAKGKHLAQIVHFGHQQIFDAATTYTCLLFLDKAGRDQFRVVKVDDLQDWHNHGKANKRTIQAKRISDAEWNLSVEKGAELFERLGKMPSKLGDIADIFVGLQTSADNVFILDFIEARDHTLKLKSTILNSEVTLEDDLLFPLVSGTDVNRYTGLPKRQFVLFPYIINDQTVTLIDFNTISKRYPKTASYLLQNKIRLENRENGRMKGNKWHGYIYLKNMTRQSHKKLCVPRLVETLYAAYDAEGNHFLDNVDVGGITLKPIFQNQKLEFLLGLLNSSLLSWYFPFVSAPFRGGWLSANKQFLSQLPIRTIDFANSNDKAHHSQIVDCVNQILAAKKANPAANVGPLEAEIDQLVYELYGLTAEEIAIVEKTGV